MNVKPRSQAILVELYKAIERAEGKGSVAKARDAARKIGYRFTNAEAALWLASFVKPEKKGERGASGRFTPSLRRPTDRTTDRPTRTKRTATRTSDGPTRTVKELQYKASPTEPTRDYVPNGTSSLSDSYGAAPASGAAAAGNPEPLPGLLADPASPATTTESKREVARAPKWGTPYHLAEWIYLAAVDANVIDPGLPEREQQIRESAVRADLREAKRLLDERGAEAAYARADRLVELCADGKRVGAPSCKKLRFAWNDADLSTPARPQVTWTAKDSADYREWVRENGHLYVEPAPPIDDGRQAAPTSAEQRDAFDKLLGDKGLAAA